MKRHLILAFLLAIVSLFPTLSQAQTLPTTHVVSALPFTPCVGSPTLFTAVDTTGTFSPLSMMSWNFGDGSSGWSGGLSNSITHTYTAPGTYTVDVIIYDSINPIAGRGTLVITVDSICASTDLVAGFVYYDLNANNIYDGGDFKRPGSLLAVNPGGYLFSTDANGEYAVSLPAGSYTIDLQPIQYFNFGNPSSGSLSVTSSGTAASNLGNDFGIVANGTQQDMQVFLNAAPPVPGFNRNYYMTYKNVGNVPVSGTLTLQFDPSFTYVGSSAGGSVSGNTVSWPYSLGPGQLGWADVTLLVPVSATIGSSVLTIATVNPIAGDAAPADNVDSLNQVVVASYDPNDKAVTPAGTGPMGDVAPSTTAFSYRVRFQNTGTFYATNVVIRDTLSSNLDPMTIRAVGASHPFNWHLSQNELVFEFLGIMLPDSNTDEPGSHGWLRFTIDRKPGLPIGTVIPNTAAIYFDFNAPVITNTVNNTLSLSASIDKGSSSMDVKIAPNPFGEQAVLRFDNPEGAQHTFVLTDLSGKVLRSQAIDGNSHVLSREGLSAGVYLFRIENTATGSSAQGKIVAH